MVSIKARHWRRTASAALGTAIGMAVSAALHAAETADSSDTLQEVVVTGIRSSLSSAAARKRDAEIVMDSITQEDLGKFPDANVAESLQRIPGVSIDRNNGEGQFVTVRGLGPQFNTVLFNGRTLASATKDASGHYAREFSFDLLAAELISGADVYKTSLARMEDGGIGATINLRTARPLDLNGFRAVVTGKANYERSSGDTTPQAFGLVSDTFADDKIGLLASVSYQKRTPSINSVTSDGYLPNVNLGPANAPLFTDVYAPRNLNVNNALDHRTRVGETLVGQYRPTDELVLTVDGLYDKFKSDSDNKSLGAWFEPSQYTAATVDAHRNVTSLTTNGNADMINQSSLRDTTTWEGGFNADWRPQDTIHVVLDATASKARDAGAGRSFFTVTGVPTTYSFAEAQGDDFPSVFDFTPGALTNPTLARTHLAQRSGSDVSDRVYEAKLDVEWKPDSGLFSAGRTGASVTDRKLETFSSGTLNVGCLYCGYPTLTDPTLLHPFTVDGLSGNVPTTFLAYDPNAYLAFLSSPAALAARDVALKLAPGTSAAQFADQSQGHGYDAVPNPSDFVREKVYAGYVEADFKGDVLDRSWLLNIGLRYVHTDVAAHSQQRALVDLLPIPNDPTLYNAVYQNNGQYVPVDKDSNYNALLPDFNLNVNLAPKLVARLAASKTLTRPELNDLRPVTSFDTTRPASLESSGGNSDLKPYRSTNYDVSLEWYPTSTTTLSAAGFYKDIKDFIVTTIQSETVTIANAGNLPVGGFITGPNEATFAAARPRNASAAAVRGVELNIVHTFDWLPGVLSGFGTQLNATFVSTNRTFDKLSPTERFAVVGLANSQNAVVFYEKYGLSARLAYNHRQRFLSSISQGYGSEPLFVRSYGQFDASISYDVTKNLQILFEGTNITDAKYITTARYDDQVRGWYDYGARFDAGVRLKF
ncbi:MAG: TonB-dependent receptor [Steroidobacteraceae bacterium]